MARFTSFRFGVVALTLFACGSLALTSNARAEAYAGAMIGLGIPSGTDIDLNSGTVYGATLGASVLPFFSIAATYLHDELETDLGGFDFSVDQFLAEANFFSLLFMNAGVHAGGVKTEFLGTSTTDLGLGLHLGFDFRLAEQVSVGAAGYWTYVSADDKYSTLNLMVPLKVWF